MNTIIINISKNSSNCTFATSKCNDDIVFNAKVQEQLKGDVEI